MKEIQIPSLAFGMLLALLALAGCRTSEQDAEPAAKSQPASTPSPATPPAEMQAGFLYGRVTTDSGEKYEGRLRWGGDQEAFWGDYFNGSKDENPWVAHVPPGRLPGERRPFTILGIQIGGGKQADVPKPFMARFGDIARIEARDSDVRVTLKSGSVFDLDRMGANDLDDGVRVWDEKRGVVDLRSWAGGLPPPAHKRIHTIELLPAAPSAGPLRLHGTVRTKQGEFTGFLQWDRQESVGSDTLDGHTADGAQSLRFDTIRAIARHSRDSCLVTLLDGREVVLSGTRETNDNNRGIYVDDKRYGRVLIAWGAFEKVEFSAGGGGPAYDDFPKGRPLMGSVATRDGRRLAGRLVYDLDESETTETLDAESSGVNYTIPFGLIASIVLPERDEGGAPSVLLTLHNGGKLHLERNGDLGAEHGGMLIFRDDGQRPDYVTWSDIAQIDFDRPPAMYPPLDPR